MVPTLSEKARMRPGAEADAILALIAVAALGSGIVVYALGRETPPYFLPTVWSLTRDNGSWLGAIGGIFPAFLHTYAFVLLTAAVVPWSDRALSICIFWFTVDSLFEFGQHPAIAPYAAAGIPAWFQHLPVLEVAKGYFLRGVFDPWDLAAIAAGTTGAYLTITCARQRSRRHGPRAPEQSPTPVRFVGLVVVVAGGLLTIIGTSGGGNGGGGAPVTMTLAATVRTPSQVEVSWTAHPEPVLGYDLFRNGSAAWPTHLSGTSFSDRNLDPATQYCYQVNAVQFLLGVVGTSNVACATTFTTAPWTLAVLDASGGEYASLALDPGSKLHVSYYDSPNSALTYATNASGAWASTIIDSGWTGFGGTSIAVDAGGVAHVSYNDYDNATGLAALRYATNASGAWVTSVVDSAGGWANSIALDAAGGAHISYMTTSPNPALRYATNASGSWETTFLAGFSASIRHSSIAIDSAAAAHIGYAVGGGGEVCAIRYATNASGSWTDTVVAAVSSTQCGASLALDSMDRPHIGYIVSFDLLLATNVSGSWASTSVDQFDWIPGKDVSIGLDSADKIHLSYQDHNADLKYATNVSGTWVASYIDAKGSVGSYSSLGVDPAGKVHIVYYDATNGDLKYARSP